MRKYMFYINAVRTVIYSEYKTENGVETQYVYDEVQKNLQTFNTGDSVSNVTKFVKILDPLYTRASIFVPVFPVLRTKEKKPAGYKVINTTLDGKHKIANGQCGYSKHVYDTDDLSTEELHWLLEDYETLKAAMLNIHNIASVAYEKRREKVINNDTKRV